MGTNRSIRPRPLSPDEALLLKLMDNLLLDMSTGCWLWLGARTRTGYGMLGHAGRTTGVHRFSAILFSSFDESTGLYILHRCDNPRCFNPEHLRPGTQAENMRDSVLKGRKAKKLTADQVLEIKRRLAMGETHASIARDYNVTRVTIGQIARGETWSHIKYDGDSSEVVGR